MYLSRFIAPLAALLASAAPCIASAATLSVDIPGCGQVQLSGTGPNYTISCTQSTMTCVAQSSPVSPQGNTTANLSVACNPAATGVTWQASRDCTAPSPSGAVGQATVSEVGGRSCVYTAVATNGNGNGSASASVVWQSAATQPPPNAPTGCSITRNPATGAVASGGGAISMSGACSGGAAVTSWSWRKNAAGGWASGPSANDTLPANTSSTAITYTYGLTACNGSSCANEVTTTFVVAGTTAQPVGFCSNYTDVLFVDLPWGGQTTTTTAGNVKPGTIVVARLAVPANAVTSGYKSGKVNWGEYSGGTYDRVGSLSTQPCDMRNWNPSNYPTDQTGVNAPLRWGIGQSGGIDHGLVGGTVQWPTKPGLQPGQTYYINIRTISSATGQELCSGTCDMIISSSTFTQ